MILSQALELLQYACVGLFYRTDDCIREITEVYASMVSKFTPNLRFRILDEFDVFTAGGQLRNSTMVFENSAFGVIALLVVESRQETVCNG